VASTDTHSVADGFAPAIDNAGVVDVAAFPATVDFVANDDIAASVHQTAVLEDFASTAASQPAALSSAAAAASPGAAAATALAADAAVLASSAPPVIVVACASESPQAAAHSATPKHNQNQTCRFALCYQHH